MKDYSELIYDIMGKPAMTNEEAIEEFKEMCYTLYGELKINDFHITELDESGRELGLSSESCNKIKQQVVSDIAQELMKEVSEKGFVTKSDNLLVKNFVKESKVDIEVDEDVYRHFSNSYRNFIEYCSLIDSNDIVSLREAKLFSNARNATMLDTGAVIMTKDGFIFAGDRKTINISKDKIRDIRYHGNEMTVMKTTSSNHVKLELI